MSIVPFPVDRARGTDPEPTPPRASRPRYVQCARGVVAEATAETRRAAAREHELRVMFPRRLRALSDADVIARYDAQAERTVVLSPEPMLSGPVCPLERDHRLGRGNPSLMGVQALQRALSAVWPHRDCHGPQMDADWRDAA